ncbi:sensor domain-containing diguanylate cyclase [Lysinibacillus sp. NPDC094177]|uniref:sensor domain-containing diguanylate cyclase n=1 Tax=Lysinibacillus sp. NPDC094177 TaxID=3390580 RepID=UPI003CFDB04C
MKKIFDMYEALNDKTILAITDTKGRILYSNQKYYDMAKYSTKELIGKTHRVINSGYYDSSFFKTMWDMISQENTWRGEICNQAKDGTIYRVDTTIVTSKNELGEVEQYIAIRHDITEKKMLAFGLENRFIYDSITGLPNSMYLEKIVEQKIQNNEPFYLLKININDFKSFNESLGLDHANQVLKKISELLKVVCNQILYY